MVLSEVWQLDDTFQVYVNRVARLTLPEAHRSQVQHIQPSPKYRQLPGGQFEAIPFPGYSIITPPWAEDSENGTFYESLHQLQQKLMQALPKDLLIPVPAESFHMTLADLIWDSAYLHAVDNPGFEAKLRDRISHIFEVYQPLLQTGKPMLWQVLGISVRTRAVGVCLAPKDEGSYEQVVRLRRAVYQDQSLIALGIEQQYHLTAHITLGYFGNIPTDFNRDTLSDILTDFNHEWLDHSRFQTFLLHRAELRRFDDMTRYYRQPEWPTLSFE